MARSKKKQYYYRVRNMATGLFLVGGFRIGWNTRGKVWHGLSALKSSMKMKFGNRPHDVQPTWEVIEYELTQVSAFNAQVLAQDWITKK